MEGFVFNQVAASAIQHSTFWIEVIQECLSPSVSLNSCWFFISFFFFFLCKYNSLLAQHLREEATLNGVSTTEKQFGANGSICLVAPTKRHSPFGSIFQMRAQLTCKQMQAQQSRTADSSLFRHYWHVLIRHYSRGSWWGNIITGCWCEVIECNLKNGP